MKKFLYLVSILVLVSTQSALAQPPANPGLRAELLQMQEVDQAIRLGELDTPEQISALDAIDAKHTARLKEVIEAYGWPTVSLVGEEGASAAWLLAQHADADPNFQRRVLELMGPLIKTGEAKPSSYAYLWDRTHTPQRYGTQGRCVAKGQWEPRAIELPEQVDTRRAEVGLPPMADYEKLVSGYCPGDD